MFEGKNMPQQVKSISHVKKILRSSRQLCADRRPSVLQSSSEAMTPQDETLAGSLAHFSFKKV
jgi:hypothetical protein